MVEVHENKARPFHFLLLKLIYFHRLGSLRTEKSETPADTLNELQKWALECKTKIRCFKGNI
jgi:hypothetical protein